MKLVRAIFVNRAPFEHLDLDFNDGHINVLTGINGRGKTTILSYIVDAFHEFARPYFSNSYAGKETKFYRFSSSIFTIDETKSSYVYLRFEDNNHLYDYIDIRGNLQKNEYDKNIPYNDKIDLEIIQKDLKGNNGLAKIVSKNLKKDIVNDIFNTHVLTYFPSYRYETPG